MSTTLDLLHSLAQRGVLVSTHNGQIHIRVPKGTEVERELDELSTRRSEVIGLLEQAGLATDVSLQPRATIDRIPLTARQMQMWNWIKQSRAPSTRVVSFAQRILGPLDIVRVRKCITALVGRHEALRTRFVVVDGRPTQCVDEPAEHHLDVAKLSDVPAGSCVEAVTRVASEFASQSVELSTGPLLAAKVIIISVTEHVLIVAAHHMISDGVSLRILERELWTLYAESKKDPAFELPEQSIQLADYAVWQLKTREAWIKTHGNLWRRYLTDAPCVTLPLDNTLIETPSHIASETLYIPFGATLSGGLQTVARREQVLLASVVLTVYVALMAHWCNRNELLVLAPTHGRFCPELVNAVGWFSFPQHLRIEVANKDTFRDLLIRVNSALNFASAHLDFGQAAEFNTYSSNELFFNWAPVDWAQGIICRERRVVSELTVLPFALPRDLGRARFAAIFSRVGDEVVASVMHRSELRAAAKWFGQGLLLFSEAFVRSSHTRLRHISLKQNP